MSTNELMSYHASAMVQRAHEIQQNDLYVLRLKM